MLAVWSGVLALFSVLAAGALIWIATTFTQMTEAAAASVESVYLLEEAEIDLLLHARATDDLVRRDLEASLRDKLQRARGFVSTAGEARTVEDTIAKVEAHLEGARAGRMTAQGAAFDGLETSVAVNLAHARTQQVRAESLSRASSVIGVVLAIVLVVVTSFVLVGMRRQAFRPMLDLAGAMRRFGEGDRAARATEHGFQELLDMSSQFNAMAAALVAQRQSQLALIAGVAHDLRQPLSALSLTMDVLGNQDARGTDLDRLVEVSRRQLRHLERMVNDFLEVSKLEGGKLELTIRRADLRAIVQDVVTQQFDAAANDRLLVRIPDGPLEVECDAGRVAQAVSNLISNALKYSPPSEPVEVVVEAQGADARISVVDRGPGLTPEQRARLFQPFQRLRATQGPPGIGLGLYVVRRVAEALDGRVEVESTPGRGSRFTITIPVRARGCAMPPREERVQSGLVPQA